jgi:hypothetical protein
MRIEGPLGHHSGSRPVAQPVHVEALKAFEMQIGVGESKAENHWRERSMEGSG